MKFSSRLSSPTRGLAQGIYGRPCTHPPMRSIEAFRDDPHAQSPKGRSWHTKTCKEKSIDYLLISKERVPLWYVTLRDAVLAPPGVVNPRPFANHVFWVRWRDNRISLPHLVSLATPDRPASQVHLSRSTRGKETASLLTGLPEKEAGKSSSDAVCLELTIFEGLCKSAKKNGAQNYLHLDTRLTETEHPLSLTSWNV